MWGETPHILFIYDLIYELLLRVAHQGNMARQSQGKTWAWAWCACKAGTLREGCFSKEPFGLLRAAFSLVSQEMSSHSQSRMKDLKGKKAAACLISHMVLFSLPKLPIHNTREYDWGVGRELCSSKTAASAEQKCTWDALERNCCHGTRDSLLFQVSHSQARLWYTHTGHRSHACL